MTNGNRSSVYVGVFLLSCAALLLEVALTRLFSFTLWYHFAYMTIGVALLGYGASGALLAAWERRLLAEPERLLRRVALIAGLAILVMLVGVALVPFDPFLLLPPLDIATNKHAAVSLSQLLYMALNCLLVAVPFVLVGLAIGLAIRTSHRDVARVYLSELAGAGIGAAITVPAILLLGTPGAVLLAAGLAFGAATVFAFGRRKGVTVPVLGIMLLVATGRPLLRHLEFVPSAGKGLSAAYFSKDLFRYPASWTPIYRVDVYGWKDEEFTRSVSYSTVGLSKQYDGHGHRARFISHDGTAEAVMLEYDNKIESLKMLDYHILRTPYLLKPSPDVLVIGVGGGIDVLTALRAGAHTVTGIELDPVTVDIIKHRESEFTGGFPQPNVHIVAAEGRSYVRRSMDRFDVIQMTQVDTLSALTTGAYVLSESYLYTVEAVEDYLAHLKPGGILDVVMGEFNWQLNPKYPPRHTLRVVSLFKEALARRGLADASRHIIVLASTEGHALVPILLKLTPFTPEEIDRAVGFAKAMGFQVWYAPGQQIESPHARLIEGRPLGPELEDLNLEPTTDNNPFFFNFYRWASVPGRMGEISRSYTFVTGQLVLVIMLLFAVVLSLLVIILPLLLTKRADFAIPGRWGFIAYFLGLGLGFIMVEISMVQRYVLFLGYPTYSLTVVLSSFLVFSGLGSYLSDRLVRPTAAQMTLLVLTLALLLVGYLPLVGMLFQRTLMRPFAVRVAIAVATLLPLGLVMGMFFPTGIRALAPRPVFVPWAWAANGCASVVGTVVAVMLAMAYGFRAVSLVALVCYAAGVGGILSAQARGPLTAAPAG